MGGVCGIQKGEDIDRETWLRDVEGGKMKGDEQREDDKKGTREWQPY